MILGDVASLKDQSFSVKEGSIYRLRINFCVQREIVTGLKLIMKTSRKGIKGKLRNLLYLSLATRYALV